MRRRLEQLAGVLGLVALFALGQALADNGTRNPPPHAGTLPAQAGHSGQYLGTNGSVPSWSSPIATQSGHSGQFLTTDGSATSWGTPVSDLNPYSIKTYFDNVVGAANNHFAGGNQTSGAAFMFLKSATVTGCRFYWGATANVVRVKLWAMGNPVALSITTFATSGAAGWFTATFTGAQSMAPWVVYACTAYDSSGAHYDYFNMRGAIGGTVSSGDAFDGTSGKPFMNTASFIWSGWNIWGVGDAEPTQGAGTERYPVEPIFTIP